ncbi:MAG TPA: efflux RND transporter periplasmic adaptor subunit, partial [Patescibacteria group bacterium]|nr:efflux RND transporter periplasmic adaptor subunit [Patescibacteria group bacterium]
MNTIRERGTRLLTFAKLHKKLAGFLILVLIAAGYYGYKNMTTTAAEIQYVSEAAAIGTISTSVSGTGQVSSSNQVDVKPSVSAKVVSISVKEGDTVKQGATLLTLDSGDAYKVVRDAQVNLQSARLS